MGKRMIGKVSDFRYDSGMARIPWPAVGEKIRDRRRYSSVEEEA